MAEFNKSIGDWKKWDSAALSKYLQQNGIAGSYAEMFTENNIDGKTAPRITESHLQEMGINKIGDRITIINILDTLKKAQDLVENTREIWSGKEMLFDSNLSWACVTCFGACPRDPKTYVLTQKDLQIRTFNPKRCLCIELSCLYPFKSTDNIDLSTVQDVDFHSIPPSCVGQLCCGMRVKDTIVIDVGGDGKKVMVLRKKQGEEVTKRIKQQVEVSQRMERS
eukprot:CAMPEP_0194265818 /NCGR_PEP_ID=MMETSP0169-20130528/934_1 /TAXON_ID=218684 /ORGANISM="Corethron pennatum, Strain L29A3" /LENGTH=222 /DNA_ID=CAMNT_0039006369 /DNA_START=96 /DNA_END=764 /DNA_ORIENTATION=+